MPDAVQSSTTPWQHRKLTPMLQQYVQAKALCPNDAILMFRMGDFFELFFDDAKIAAKELGLTLTARDKSDDPIPMAGVPHHAISGYIAKLVNKGYTIAICDQVEDPQQAKGIVKREITRVITPGTATDLEALDPGSGAYLACVQPLNPSGDTERVALAFLDLLAGEILCTIMPASDVEDELQRMAVREVLVAGDVPLFSSDIAKAKRLTIRRLDPKEASKDPLMFLQSRIGRTDILGFELLASEHANEAERQHLLEQLQAAITQVLVFAESTQRCAIQHLSVPKLYDLNAYLMLDETTRRNLELTRSSFEQKKHGSLLWHLDQCRTNMGSRTLLQWLLFPLRDVKKINNRLDAVGYFKDNRNLRDQLQKILLSVYDIERLTGRVALGRATPRDLGSLLASLQQIPKISALLCDTDTKPPHAFLRSWQRLDVVQDLVEMLDEALEQQLPVTANEGKIFKRGYRGDLDELITLCTDGHTYLADLEARERELTNIPSLKVRYNRVFGYYLEITKTHLKQVPARYTRKQTLVNAERYITDELKSFEEKVIDAESRRTQLEAKLFEELLDQVAACIPRLRRIATLVARLDVLMSLGQVAQSGRYCRPTIESKPVLRMKQARHPVIERLMPNGERFVPNDIVLDAQKEQVLLITGPNMAGKSTVMRQTALCAIMAQIGAFVPAQEAVIGLCDRIFTRVGASDHLGRGQSTFMVEMVETANILSHATKNSLVLFDEIGRGTSTFDGVSIAWAVAEFLHDVSQCRSLFATHYHELIALAKTHPRIKNMSVAIQRQNGQLVFLRHLVEGGANKSYGIEVARLAAVPEQVLRRAQTILDSLEKDTTEKQNTIRSEVQKNILENVSDESKRQMSLFHHLSSGENADLQPKIERAKKIENKIRRINVNQLTPLQALNVLGDLRSML